MSKRKKKIIIKFVLLGGLSIILNVCIAFFVFKIFEPIHHYGYDDGLIDTFNIEHNIKKNIYTFYTDYLNFTKYNSYSTKIYYSYWEEKVLFHNITTDFSCSYVIYAKDDYFSLMNQIKEENVFFERNESDDNSIHIDEWSFEEIYCNLTPFTNGFYESSFKKRNPSFWLGYNSITKEISFSALLLYVSKDLTDDALSSIFYLNFYM